MFNLKMIDLNNAKHAGRVLASLVAAVALVLITNCASDAATFAQKHPRRAEVLRRDRGLKSEVKADRGKLGGHDGQLSREDNAIARQEQRDARVNGGYITKQQKRQLNQEENQVTKQIRQDDTGL